MGRVVGVYKEYGISDRIDFVDKMRSGMSYEEYVEERKKKMLVVAIGPGKSARNRYVPYEYEVDGKTYYGTTYVAYSMDIFSSMVGKPCVVEYDDEDPYQSKIAKDDKVSSGVNTSVKSMIFGIISFCTSFFVLPSVVLSILGFVFFAKAKKQEEFNKSTGYAGLIFSILGLVAAALILILGSILGFGFIIMIMFG